MSLGQAAKTYSKNPLKDSLRRLAEDIDIVAMLCQHFCDFDVLTEGEHGKSESKARL